MKSLFEQMGGTYTLGADGIYYPNLSLPEEEEPRYGKYGRMRHTYPKEHRQAQDQMKWVGAMNNIRNAAEEIVLNELIYR